MSNLTDLATEISTQLQLLVASATVIKLTRQQSSTASVDTTVLTAAANHAARSVRRALGDVSDTDDDAVDFGTRIALLRLVSFYSLTLTESGAAYAAGVHGEMAEEAKARRQSYDAFEAALEDFTEEDLRWPDTPEWDRSNGQES